MFRYKYKYSVLHIGREYDAREGVRLGELIRKRREKVEIKI